VETTACTGRKERQCRWKEFTQSTIGETIVKKIIAALCALLAFADLDAQSMPIFDAHMHYNIEARVEYPPEKVLEIFERNNVRGILANSRPNEGSELLAKLAATKAPNLNAVAFIRVYRDRADYGTWHKNPEIVAMIEREFASGFFAGKVRGIGEFHIYGDEAKSKEFTQIVAFAKKHDLWLHAHCDEAALAIVFQLNPNARVIWAHTGFSVATEKVANLMKQHAGLMGELSYRNDITEGGKLSKQWRTLFTAHADRFLLGSDCWVTERWAQYDELMSYYRTWLAELPKEKAELIAFRNGERMFGIKLK
jgi:Tat protein secretion system quality control protein TatD with DNase activity